jgi:predicted nucleotidyltransferase
METLQKIKHHRLAIFKIIEDAGGSVIHLYGSVAKGTDTPESDIDFLINCHKESIQMTMIAVAGMTYELEMLLEREVHIHVRSLLRRDVVRTLINNTVPL